MRGSAAAGIRIAEHVGAILGRYAAARGALDLQGVIQGDAGDPPDPLAHQALRGRGMQLAAKLTLALADFLQVFVEVHEGSQY